MKLLVGLSLIVGIYLRNSQSQFWSLLLSHLVVGIWSQFWSGVSSQFVVEILVAIKFLVSIKKLIDHHIVTSSYHNYCRNVWSQWSSQWSSQRLVAMIVATSGRNCRRNKILVRIIKINRSFYWKRRYL